MAILNLSPLRAGVSIPTWMASHSHGKHTGHFTDFVALSITVACVIFGAALTSFFDPPTQSGTSSPASDLGFLPYPDHRSYTPDADSVFCEHVRLGLRYVPACFGSPPEHVYPLLITSTGRSGTKYTAQVLQQLGYNVTHDDADKIGSDGAVSWPLATNAEQSYPDWVAHPGKAKFKTLIHQVRDPLKSIPSRASHIVAIQTPHVELHTPEMQRMTAAFRNNSLAVALLHYVTWHSLIERQNPDMRFRIEALDVVTVRRILQTAGLTLPIEAHARISEVLGEALKDTNTRHVALHNDVTWSELFAINTDIAQRAYDMATRYGYTYDSETQELPIEHKFDLST
jgi:hypothetical protein